MTHIFCFSFLGYSTQTVLSEVSGGGEEEDVVGGEEEDEGPPEDGEAISP